MLGDCFLWGCDWGGVSACPNPTLWGEQYSRTGDDLSVEEDFLITAGGDTEIANCKMRFRSDQGSGFVTDDPDFTFTLSRMDRFALEISVASVCDSILLINTPLETGSTMTMTMGTWTHALT
ncbi:MAG: hypothetical protein OXE84_08365 [Rhodobacteraceae bacterium]|nr:hypothetical protein [Paracoccaceae bacterium]